MSAAADPAPVAPGILDAVAAGAYFAPHDVLGEHPVDGGVLIRARRPLAARVEAVFPDGTTAPLAHERAGVWAGVHTGATTGPYRIRAAYDDGSTWTAEDPYRFTPTLGDVDLHLIREGRHERLWDALGAHLREHEGVAGASFAVWAPNARAVRVIGDLNGWDGAGHAMRSMGGAGVWELFVPGVAEGERYKFEILTADGRWIQKADPLARLAEEPPATASVVTASAYAWGDDEWMARRARSAPHREPMSIYELHLGSWRQGLSYRDAADQIIGHVRELGFTHVEFLPLAEHPFGGSWGYQVSGYYAPTSRFGSPDDLRYLIDRLHGAGIGVLVDWVPGHFPKDDFALARFDGQALYEHPDPRRGEHRDWGTYVFDYGRREVRNFLVANALYWFEQFHIDGLRVDAVASMLYLDYSRDAGDWEPNVYGGRENLEAIGFLQEVTATSYRLHPGVAMIAEESTSFPGVTAPTSQGGLGFGFKWNMGWMNDSLQYFSRDPLYRAHHEGEITFTFAYAFTENFVLPISHDEVVHGKGTLLSRMPGDHAQKLAGARAFLAFQWSHPGKQLLFMGQEFGQLSEWAEGRSLDWWMLDQPAHVQLQAFVAALNARYRALPALWQHEADPSYFERVYPREHRGDVVGYARRDDDGGWVVALCNFGGAPVRDAEFDLPAAGVWDEVLNSDAQEYGGAGDGNLGAVHAEALGGADASGRARITLPALGVIWLRRSV